MLKESAELSTVYGKIIWSESEPPFHKERLSFSALFNKSKPLVFLRAIERWANLKICKMSDRAIAIHENKTSKELRANGQNPILSGPLEEKRADQINERFKRSNRQNLPRWYGYHRILRASSFRNLGLVYWTEFVQLFKNTNLNCKWEVCLYQ